MSETTPALDGLDLRGTVRALKAAHGWKDEDLAAAAGCGRTTVNSFLNKRISLHLDKMEAMLAAFGYRLVIVKMKDEG